MAMPDKHQQLQDQIERQTQRMRKADRERATLMRQTVYVGTLGLVFVLPVIGGAYLGQWLDGLAPGYSTRWTVSLILVGIFIGGLNVYQMLKD